MESSRGRVIGWMAVIVSDDNGAPGSWRWNVKQRRGARWETIAKSDRGYLEHRDAMAAAQAFMSAERIWDLPGHGDG